MQCPNCSAEIVAGLGCCPHCGQQLDVKVLTRQERDNFAGITIEEPATSDSRRQYGGYESSSRARIKHVNFAFNSSSWTGKLIIAAVLLVLVFFFLPLLMFILLTVGAVLIIVWLVRMLRR